MPETINPRVKIGGNAPPSLTDQLKDKHAALLAKAKSWERKAKSANLEPVTIEDCVALDKLFADGRDLDNDGNSIREVEKKPYWDLGKEVDAVFHTGIRDVIGVKGGLAEQLNRASAQRKVAITKAQQAAQQAEAEKLAREAAKHAGAAQRHEEAGRNSQADVAFNRADAAADAANAAAAAASKDIGAASRTTIGGITSSVKVKLIATDINRATLDLEALRPFLRSADLIWAAQKALDQGFDVKGVVTREDIKGSVRR
jgi:hypothetical protein